MATNYQKDIERVSEETLDVFDAIASAADSQLREPYSPAPTALASVNTFTSGEAIETLSGIGAARRSSLETLAREPAIARVVTRADDGESIVYYICRDTPTGRLRPGKRLAGRNSPAGRLASLAVGEEFEISVPGGSLGGEIVEKAILHPLRRYSAWDSRDSILEGQTYGPITVLSMRDALAQPSAADVGDGLLADILAADEKATNVINGIRRNVIIKMGLRDQPILDRYQDEIFRLPLNSQLLIIGPPGTGKTTTLIRRLGQKLDREYLDEDERRLADGGQVDGARPHADSWMMFTPTDLLKLYLKEAFAREHIAAPDQKISTWSRFRLHLARNHFRILRTPNGGGPFILKDAELFIQQGVLDRQTAWYEDFSNWQSDDFWADLRGAANLLANAENAEARRLAESLTAIVADAGTDSNAQVMTALADAAENVGRLLQEMKEATDGAIRRGLTLQVHRDPQFLEKLAVFLDSLGTPEDEPDDPDGEDEEETQAPRTRMAAAMSAYMRNLRSQARARFGRRTIGRTTRVGRIAEWIHDRTLAEGDLRDIGKSLQTQASLRRFTRPVRRYIHGIAARYRRFRRARQSENNWYVAHPIGASDVDPLEVDLMLLCVMQASSSLLRDRTIRRNIDEPAYAVLKDFMGLVRNQIMVDEATDFSPIQLACMGALSSPGIQSFFACGDFNQRITSWGSRSIDEMHWAFPRIEVRPIQVSYRHSRQLNQLATEIVRLCAGETVDVALPDDVDNEGVAPVLGTDLAQRDDIIDWLALRIIEIEMFTKPLPSVAVLVNDEAEVGPLADGLKAALADQNLNVVACYKGQFAGQENDVRVFDVQHIKGLEFEAVFFIGVDTLATLRPELFDKYLYVGTTRAATYLGLTCTGAGLPEKIESLQSSFAADWRQ
jgi:DNA polymerase III delta prime subunit